MNVLEKQTKINLIELELKNKQEVIDNIDSLCEVVQKFDSKVFSKRLETALQKVLPNIRCYLQQKT